MINSFLEGLASEKLMVKNIFKLLM